MKFQIRGNKYDTDTLSRLQVRVLISKINKMLSDAEVARLEAVKTFDTAKLKEIQKAEEGLQKIITSLKKIYEKSNKL